MGYWEITIFFMGFGVSFCSIVSTIEIILSFLRKPCEDWKTVGSSANCTLTNTPFCGLMAHDLFVMKDNGNKYFLTSRLSPCITISSLHIFTIVILCCLVIVVIGGSGITKLCAIGKATYARRFYTTFLGVSLFLILCWISQLITVSATTSGYVQLCNVLSKPRCSRYPSDIFTSIDCHFGSLHLPTCDEFSMESFVGRLRVALGLSWIGFILMTFLLVVTILKLRTEIPTQKIIARKQEEQRIIQQTVYPTHIPSVYLYPPSSIHEEDTYNDNSARYNFQQPQAPPPIPSKRMNKNLPEYDSASHPDSYLGGYRNGYYDNYTDDFDVNEAPSYNSSRYSQETEAIDYGESTF